MSHRALVRVLRSVVVTALAASPPAASQAAAVPAGPVVAGEVGKRLDAHLTSVGYSGGALVAVKGEVVLLKGYGLADREKQIPYAADTVYPIGSVTKQFTAAAILRLEMAGRLNVNDPIARHLDGVPEDKRAITIHHLLTHTAGLESDFARDYDPIGRDEYVKLVLASKLRSKPGDTYFYSNSGYSLLGAIVEHASGLGYEAFLHKELFQPAGMPETGYKIPKWPTDRVAVGYGPNGRWGTILEKKWIDDGPGWALRANGGIHSTLLDMYRYSLALDGTTILSDAEKKEMFSPQVPEGPEKQMFYGYGWTISTTPWNTKLVEHNGGNRIYSADFRRYVDDRIVVLTGANDAKLKAFDVSGDLVRIARGESPRSPAGGGSSLKPLGDSPRHAAIRAYLTATNSGDLATVRAFRAKHMKPSQRMTEAERDEVYQRMHGEMGRLELLGIVEETPETVIVAVRSAKVDLPIRLEFRFGASDGAMIEGLGVTVGQGH